ncbi:MAG: hypothetical protein AAF721_40065 [Myxococcota bacterium]
MRSSAFVPRVHRQELCADENTTSTRGGGGTNGPAGITAAYDLAHPSFIEGGVNRVILATDGDFNVGTTDLASLQALIEAQRQSGVYLSVFGFGKAT